MNGDCDPCKALALLYCSTMTQKLMEDEKGRFSRCIIGSFGTASIRKKGLLVGQSVHNWMDGWPADPRRRPVRSTRIVSTRGDGDGGAKADVGVHARTLACISACRAGRRNLDRLLVPRVRMAH
jgi:hypothetical protein